MRLEPAAYARDGAAASITARTRKHQPFFARSQIATCVIDILRERSEKQLVPVYAYCFMPDHMHLVIGAGLATDILTFVAQFKSLAARACWPHGARPTIWQDSFRDDVVRKKEGDLLRAMTYALRNPEAAGLVSYWADYPYCGSFTFSRDQLLAEHCLGRT